MLEVGRVAGTDGWNRAHFGAWCIVSAPLVLGMDLTDEKLAPVLDVIGNKNALKVNHAWDGHPGSLVRTLPDPAPAPPAPPGPAPPPGTYAVGVKCDPKDETQTKWTAAAGTIKHGDMCLDVKDKHQLRLAACDGSDAQKFTPDATTGGYKAAGGCLDIFGSATCKPVVDRRVDIFACNSGENQAFDVDSTSGTIKAKCGECLAARQTAPAGGGHGGGEEHSQLWAKPIGKGAVAALFINGGATNRSATIHLSELNITASEATVLDIWSGEEVASGKTTGGEYTTPMVPGTDSAFLIFTPVS